MEIAALLLAVQNVEASKYQTRGYQGIEGNMRRCVIIAIMLDTPMSFISVYRLSETTL